MKCFLKGQFNSRWILAALGKNRCYRSHIKDKTCAYSIEMYLPMGQNYSCVPICELSRRAANPYGYLFVNQEPKTSVS